MNRFALVPVLSILLLLSACTRSTDVLPDSAAGALDTEQKLNAVLQGEHRSEGNKARDAFRNPVETLQFFGLEPDMTVVEITPGGGWYTEILAPFLREEGTYIAAGFDPESPRDYHRTLYARFADKLAEHPDIYDHSVITVFDPEAGRDIAPAGSADMVLSFRNVHGWVRGGTAEEAFEVFFTALKPGGTLGVVAHRADPETPHDPEVASGYLHESLVISLAEDAGFTLVDSSEINANPLDTRDHPRGVWTLPPNLRLGEEDREKYLAIGESDRMTLKFRKPE